LCIQHPLHFLCYMHADPCDASELLPKAETVGDCTATLPAGSSCMNTVSAGFTCTASVCSADGTFSPGLCKDGKPPPPPLLLPPRSTPALNCLERLSDGGHISFDIIRHQITTINELHP
jgi:hypothetical protein